MHVYSVITDDFTVFLNKVYRIVSYRIVTGGRHLGFSNFQILFKFSLLYLRLMEKQHLAVEIHEIGKIHCEIVSI